MSSPKNLKDLFIHTLKDIYYAEQEIAKALPVMEQRASNSELKKGFKAHLKETKTQIERLNTVFELCNEKAKGQKCPAIEGILKEGEEVMKTVDDNETRDAAIIAAAQAVEHYEIARYVHGPVA